MIPERRWYLACNTGIQYPTLNDTRRGQSRASRHIELVAEVGLASGRSSVAARTEM